MPNTRKAKYPANPDAPVFTPDRWIREGSRTEDEPAGRAIATNCYQYATGGSAIDGSNILHDKPAVVQPGATRGHLMTEKSYTPHGLLNLVALDGLKPLPYTGRGDAVSYIPVPPNKPGFYVVGVYYENIRATTAHEAEVDFHFLRQDIDGGWSQKEGYQDLARVNRYLPPAADGGYRPLPTKYGESYRFAGYAYVPKQGIDGGLVPMLTPSILAYRAAGQDECRLLNTLFDPIVGEKPEKHRSGSIDYLRDIAATMKKSNIIEATEAYEACLDTYLKNLKKPLRESELSIDRR